MPKTRTSTKRKASPKRRPTLQTQIDSLLVDSRTDNHDLKLEISGLKNRIEFLSKLAFPPRGSVSQADQIGTLTRRVFQLEQQVAWLNRATGGLWLQADKTLIAVRDMSDNHLHNSIQLLKTNAGLRRQRPEALAQLEAEVTRREQDRKWARLRPAPASLAARLGISTALAELRRLQGGPWPEGTNGAAAGRVINDLENLLEAVLP